MKTKTAILLTLLIINFQTKAISPPIGMAERYEREDGSNAQENLSNHRLIPRILVDGEEVQFEKNTLLQVKAKLGGEIKDSGTTQWLCYKNQITTFWFISNNEMQHGDLSGVALSSADKNEDCKKTQKTIVVKIHHTEIGTSWDYFSSIWKTETLPKSGSVWLYSELPAAKNFIQLNMANFTFRQGKLADMLFTQVTSN